MDPLSAPLRPTPYLPAFRRDHARQNALVLAGWTVVRVDWHAVWADPDAVLATITAAVAA